MNLVLIVSPQRVFRKIELLGYASELELINGQICNYGLQTRFYFHSSGELSESYMKLHDDPNLLYS